MPVDQPSTPKRRGRPARVDRQRIVAAAIDLAAEEGAGAVSMTAVARRLGVAMPALYYHVRNVDDLLGLVAAEVLEQMPLPDVRLRWDRWLAAFARDLRALLQAQPLLTRVPYLAVHQPFPASVTERALRVLTRAGLGGIEAVVSYGDFVRWVVDHVHSEHAQAEEILNGRHPMKVLRQRADAVPAAQIPVYRAVLEELADVPDDVEGLPDVRFEWALGMQLAAFQVLLEGRVRPGRGPRPR